MGALTYIANVSLDGYIEDEHGSFEWTATDDEVFAFLTDLIRPVRTFLYGRRLYETMSPWETDPALAGQSALWAEFASVWQGSDKVVYSRSLPQALTANTRVERSFDVSEVRAMKASTSGELTVGGAQLAAQAFGAGLVDECHLLVRPVLLGGGKPALPSGIRSDLELLGERRLSRDVVYLRYRVAG